MSDTGLRSNLDDLKRKSVRGGAVTFLAQGLLVLIHLASTVVLARLLSPEDYGLISMVLAITAFAGLFRDLGLSTASVQRSDLTQAQLNTLFWINVGMGCALTVIVAAVSPLVAWFYREPAVLELTIALSAVFIISALGAQHGATLQRTMQFRRKSLTSVSGALVTLVVSIVLAYLGYRAWALAWGTLAGALVTTLMLFALSPFRPGAPAFSSGMASVLKFGGHVTAFELVNYFNRNLDQVLIGRVWGAASLGLYARAYQLLMFPISNLRAPLITVAFPAMSRLKGEPAAFRQYYRRVTSVLAFASMPLVAFLYVAAEPLVVVALGSKWMAVAPIFQGLAFAAFLQPVASLRGLVTLSAGKTGDYLKLGVVNAAGSSVAFVIGLPWGPYGVALAYSIANYVLLYPTLSLAFRGTGVQMSDFFAATLRPAAASALAAAVCSIPALQNLLPASAAVRLVGLAVAFALVWLVAIVCVPGGAKEFKGVFMLLRMLKADRVSNKMV
jgi:PST family polysaccharide transporter